MEQLNLVLEFRVEGQDVFEFKGVSRIQIDGRGGVVAYNAQSGLPERIDISRLRSFTIHSLEASAHSTAYSLAS